MVGDWFVQVHPASGGAPEDEIHFPDFAETLAFVKAFKGRTTNDILKVHAPARATNEERQELKDNGAIPN